MDPSTFNKFCRVIHERSGIALSPGKEALVSARVAKRMRALKIEDYKTYLRHVLEDRTGQEIVHLIDAISTNVTSFFRESPHFDFLSQVVREWLSQKCTRLRFWCAASSSGEEPYSLAMTLSETLGDCKTSGLGPDVQILATDISARVLEKARAGNYSAERVETVPIALRDRYFDRKVEDGEVRYIIRPAVVRMVKFAWLNLAEPPFPMHGPFDAVLCRNVMIYFDKGVRTRLLAEIGRLLKPGGFLFVGQSESLTGRLSTNLKIVRPSIYVKAG